MVRRVLALFQGVGYVWRTSSNFVMTVAAGCAQIVAGSR